MPNRERAIEILRGQNNISFSFTAPSGIQVAVDSSTFRYVATAISDGRIELNFDVSRLPRGIYARYRGLNRVRRVHQSHTFISGIMDLHRSDSILAQTALIHESVHASLDLTRSCFSFLENEAAAYIADSLYLKSIYGNAYNNNHPDPTARAALNAAKQIVDNLPSNGVISTDEIKNLMNALYQISHYHYRASIQYTCDG